MKVRTYNIAVRVTRHERAIFLRQAREQGLSLSAWVRMTLRGKVWPHWSKAMQERKKELQRGYMLTCKAIEDREYAGEKRRR